MQRKGERNNQEIFKILLNNNCQENWTLRLDFVSAKYKKGISHQVIAQCLPSSIPVLARVGCLCVLIAHIKLSPGHLEHNALCNLSESKTSRSVAYVQAVNQF